MLNPPSVESSAVPAATLCPSPALVVLHTAEALRLYRRQCTGAVVLVPTMGNLHRGHMALIQQAKQQGQHVIVSIFVNPTQFGPTEDYDRYPRTLEADIALLKEQGLGQGDAIFAPSVETLYPEGLYFATDEKQTALGTMVVPPTTLSHRYCGANRPGHFTGVATVVLKLFNLVQPTHAVFGEKDAQQVAVLQQMVRDLCLPVTLLTVPVVRDADGLALSSRNQYLNGDEERQLALCLSRLIAGLKKRLHTPTHLTPVLTTVAQEVLLNEVYPCLPASLQARPEWHYIEAVDPNTWQPQQTLKQGSRLLLAAKVGTVRLIDTALL